MTVRVLYAPRNISGQAGEYAAAVAPLGFRGEVWSFGETAFGFSAGRTIDQERLLTDPGFRWEVLDNAVRNFDIFHFQYGRSLLNPEGVTVPELWDLPLLKSLGKRVFMHFRGSDVRLRSVHVEREPDSYLRDPSVPCDEARITARVSVARRFSDRLLVSTPGLVDYVPDAVWIPHVIDVRAFPRRTGPPSEVPVVVHLPSSRTTKGSDIVDRVLTELDAEGICVYRPLRDLDRAGVFGELARADLLVDSLTIGDHGLVSIEAMAAGVVPLCHIHERNRERNPGVPIPEVTITTLGAVVRDLAADPDRRIRLREECRAWVERHHDRPVVGALLADLYRAPRVTPSLPYPDWPRADSRLHIRRLEDEIERLRQDVDPLLRGVGPLRRSTPSFLISRLLARVELLEEALRQVAPKSPLLQERGRRALGSPPVSARELVRARPRLHRFARSAAKTLKRVRP